ncbi:MAG TPA: AMMECR1 domain-containing protein, partial [Candidatus Saccharimonadales bacterium]|nr:AMMECR1 domain-containing protein [Candidatus Saccharimonadales bacterium]
MIAPEQRRVLLDRARRALSSLLAPRSSAGTPPATGSDSPLPGHNGIFVTLRCRGELHGCIGTLDAGLPLGRAVEGCSISAARDPRFPPLAASDLPETRIEISVMGPGRVVA